ncbi:membrane magnesium transporter-domain-containing protein [Kockovaella imperatae]|uniref:Membrane magnesium transporter-domain-containing protein n=1 Tax=Kockovaella imperatae TaxID=4999 RepID=A0A1Y1UQE1_9TREE|nr:membrane magnesium transporter-domain-containing protein [Kockovaella imperatae]ORX40253.1 membrane magnesium transporter-domain-containing protein [Kockovaella imperatae]
MSVFSCHVQTMATKGIGKILVVVSCLMLLHAAYSTYEYLSTLKALGHREATTTLPQSIVVEAVLSLLLFVPSIAISSSPLRDVTYRGEMATRSIDDADARMGFLALSPRGRALFGQSQKD